VGEVVVSQAFRPRFCPECGGVMGRDAKVLCHDCQATKNLEHTYNHKVCRRRKK